jgi:hypothetical protein
VAESRGRPAAGFVTVLTNIICCDVVS